MEALLGPSNFTPTNVTCSSPISTNPNPTSPDSLAAPKSAMAASSSSSSSLSAAQAAANEENISSLPANSGLSRKRRRRFVRKPLVDITNQFQQRNSPSDGLFGNSGSSDGPKTLKRKIGLADYDGVEAKMSSSSKKLRMSFR